MITRIAAVLMLLAGVLIAGCGEGAPPAEAGDAAPPGSVRLTPQQMDVAAIQTASIDPRPIHRVVRVPGTVMTPDTALASVGSVVEGRVLRVRVLPGDRVRRGQALVDIHAHEVAEATKDQSAALARLDFQKQAAERADVLYDAGAISLEERQRRATDLAEAEAEVARATEMMAHLNASPNGTAVAVAPRSGIVFEVHVRPGEAVLPGAPLVELGSTEVLWVTAFVPENTAATLAPGEEVDVHFRSRPGETAPARLIRMGEWVDPANRSVEARFELLTVPEGIRPGSFAVVDVSGAEEFVGAPLPENAVVRMGDDDVIFVMDDPGVFRPIAVRAEPLRDGMIAVLDVPPGLPVVVEGAYFVKAAMEVAGETEADE